MLNPVTFLWRQLCGPQITAITQALFLYFKRLCDENLDYFNDLSLDTANTQHLSLLGIEQGLARPLVPIPDSKMFWYTQEYDYHPGYGYEEYTHYEGHEIPNSEFPSEHGFATGRYGVGGVFDKEPDGTTGYEYIPDYIFRCMLKGNSKSSGYLGGLTVLDDMLWELFQRENPGILPNYRFKWYSKSTDPFDTPGDIVLNLGTTGDWAHPYEVYAQIKLLGNTIYYPIPKLYPRISEGEATVEPEGLIHIPIDAVESEPGLSSMWLDPPITPSDTVDDGYNPEFSLEPISSVDLSTMWSTSSTWIDEQGPDYFIPLTTAEIGAMF